MKVLQRICAFHLLMVVFRFPFIRSAGTVMHFAVTEYLTMRDRVYFVRLLREIILEL